jgi:hypothetical protein
MGPGGRYASYEVEEEGGAVTRVVDLEADGEVVASLRGSDAVLTGDGHLAVLATPELPELARVEAAMDRARAASDWDAYRAARSERAWIRARSRRLHRLEIATGEETRVPLDGWAVTSLAADPEGPDIFVVAGRPDRPASTEILRVRGVDVEVVPAGPGFKSDPEVVAGGRYLVVRIPERRPVPLPPDAEAGGAETRSRPGVAVVDRHSGEVSVFPEARDPAVSADGSRLVFLTPGERSTAVQTVELSAGGVSEPVVLVRSEMEVDDPAVSPAGGWVAYQKRPVHDWEIFAVPGTGGEEVQVTREIQHDLDPLFLDESTVMATKGEGRHRRALVYPVGEASPRGVRLHHNNTVRTIAPEYEWVASRDGSRVLVVAERDGDTVSPERGVYLVHRDRPVALEAVEDRLHHALHGETDLRARGAALFLPVHDRVAAVTDSVDVSRIYQYAEVLDGFGSKYITRPGNRQAVDYLVATLRSWGYEPELQWFEPRPGLRTANVVARLPGTRDPDLVYVASSHFDSVERGPGADDNSSGTTALLETARVLRDRPLPATVEFAFFTGEEAGLLGSREYVRLAQASGKRIVGALNNDMVGWTRHHRLDNTIRYSNAGIRDVQHAAAIQFSDLITYDARYYKNTDAHAYYEAYGDIVGGIGSYPVLGSPHYHQYTDRIENVNHRLVAEVGRVTVATLMLLASSPSRIEGLQAAPAPDGPGVVVRWDASPETAVDHYVVVAEDIEGEGRTVEVPASEAPSVLLGPVTPGSTIRVKAVGPAGMEGWDWARVEAPESGAVDPPEDDGVGPSAAFPGS